MGFHISFFLQRCKNKIFGSKLLYNGVTLKERLMKGGRSVLMGYIWVQNTIVSISFSLAWYVFSKRSGLSPLATGQWKPFLAVYGGFSVIQNLAKPLTFGASFLFARYFDQLEVLLQERLGLSKQVATISTIVLTQVICTFAMFGAGISGASVAAGVPILVH